MPLSPSPPPPPPAGFHGTFRSDDAARAVYSEAAGIGRVIPRAVAVPENEADVAALVRWARENRSPLIPRGSGSSMAGGAIGDGVILDLSRLRRVSSVNATDRTVVVEAGVLRAEVNREAKARGLRFPVDPSSGSFCTIGGMVSTNAAGSHSLAFGSTRRWVRSLRCVFDDGTIAEVRRGAPAPADVAAIARFLAEGHPTIVAAEEVKRARHPGVRKESSGYATAEYARSYDLVDLLVGSEGTLAIVVAVELSLATIAAATSSVLGAFPSLESAVDAAIRARESGAVACELLDRTFLDVARSGGTHDVPNEAEAALLAEVEADTTDGAAEAAHAIATVFERAGATTVRVALDEPTETELWELRHAASPILSRLDPSLRSMQFIEDGAVPPARLAEYVRGVREILARNGIRGVIFGHAGDAHVHVNPLIDVSVSDWRSRMTRILDEVTGLVAQLGGTLTGEHGDGRLRTPLLDRVWFEDARARFALVKRCFDPHGILNPGVKVPTPGERALEQIKYDPSLSPLPAEASAALARVERERAYARSRLDLLAEVTVVTQAG
ncbi:MAG TPA: FAD-binding oxidoreductase [Gemmatimonadaceae bacterium]|nr:FAD-binding oxidoreductase [Gemmatimonadaceae bacterium]